ILGPQASLETVLSVENLFGFSGQKQPSRKESFRFVLTETEAIQLYE
ncbi:MAG: hypothetical protein PWQ29_699, partial [Verrucomicrobiota bacterium]|nr:hypothetical protein [Verrucomicrobiota bacterium]